VKILTDINLKDKIPEFYIQTFSLLYFPEDNSFGEKNQSGNTIKISGDDINISVEICFNQTTVKKSGPPGIDYVAGAGKLFYAAAGEITGIYPPWGIHTGIRPAKTAEGKTAEMLRSDYLMHKNKAELAAEVCKNGKARADADTYSLYISIPFCPTKCRYCSFVSFSTPRLLKLIPAYINKLTEETALISAQTRSMRLTAVYIGGGTPTTLDCAELESVLSAVVNNFDMQYLSEYTVECGRADTITEEKLELLKKFGVDRISVNPQTLNDEILQKIGRNHTSKDFFRAFGAARKTGIKIINTDCIIGLPDETERSMINTITTLAILKPENITVHSLCLKKSSGLKSDNYCITNAPELNDTLEAGYDILRSAGYKPYYMYRQKYAAGNLENTGFCLDNCECLYNIYMMDEIQTIFGAGAGAMTKLVRGGRIERVANYKYPYEYIERDFKLKREAEKLAFTMGFK